MAEVRSRIPPASRSGLVNGILLCAAGLAVNMAAVGLSGGLGVPLYLDTTGTFLAAALGGYMPGIVVGFASNLLKSLIDPMQLYYGVLNIITAVLTAFFARKGYYDKLGKTLLTIPVLVLVTTGLGAPLTWFLNHSDIGGLASGFATRFHEGAGFGRFGSQLAGHALYELAGQGVTVLAGCFILKLFPQSVKDNLRTGGRRQDLLPPEVLAAERRSFGTRSLRSKMILLLTVGALSISCAAAVISLRLFKESTINEYSHTARMLTSLVASLLDDEPIDDYLARGCDAEGYVETEELLYALKESYPDVQYLYVYRIQEDGCHVVFDLDTADVKGSEPGEVLPFDDAFAPYLPALFRGEPIDPIISDETFGWLLTVYYPVRDSSRTTQCYVGVDFSMNLLTAYGDIFLAKLLSMFASFFILILATGLWVVEHSIIWPINSMAYCAGAFAFDSEEAQEHNAEQIRALDIRTGDEIENLYRAFLKTTEDSLSYVKNLLHARNQVADMKEQVSVMDALATTDALTGVKNKTAYDQFTARLDAEIAAQSARFGIVMIDLNFLKRVNDTYGHEQGNVYIRQCCSMVCSVFDHSPVFRVGGDEFVVILEKSDFEQRDALLAQLDSELKARAADASLEPWERVSAAVGAAVFDGARDKNADDVFKRADQAMYANKQAMKAVRKD